MPCSARMLKCKRPCRHRELVESYNLAYLSWWQEMERACGVDETEQRMWRDSHPPPLFRDWLKYQ